MLGPMSTAPHTLSRRQFLKSSSVALATAALGPAFPSDPAWTSGAGLAAGADLLIHDAQYTTAEYAERVGWGHSSVDDAVAFADLVGARQLALFHHDPSRSDDAVDALLDHARRARRAGEVVAARQGLPITI